MLSLKKELTSTSASNHEVPRDPDHLCNLQEYHLSMEPPYDQPDDVSAASPFSISLPNPSLCLFQFSAPVSYLLGGVCVWGEEAEQRYPLGAVNTVIHLKACPTRGRIVLQFLKASNLSGFQKGKSDHGILCFYFPQVTIAQLPQLCKML